jgi:hypothetical protein
LSKYSTFSTQPVKRIRMRIRIQQRAVRMTILALLTRKRHQRVRTTRKTAQRTEEVAQVTQEMEKVIRAMREAANADQRITERTLVRLLALEDQVARLMRELAKVEAAVKRPHEAALRPGAIL